MFSSSGYFRGVTCPYFVSGLCERPHCHFRHVKPTVKEPTPLPSSSYPNPIPEDGAADASVPSRGPQSSSLLSMVGQAIKQVQRDIERDKATLTNIRSSPAVAAGGPSTSADPGSCIYKPTPITARSSSSTGSSTAAASSGLYGQRTTVPQYQPTKPTSSTAHYNPTPISVLKQKKSSTQKQSTSRYVIDPSETVAENEYDPAVNFVTGTQRKGQKRVSSESDCGALHKKQRRDAGVNGDIDVAPDAAFSEDEEGTNGLVCEDDEMTESQQTGSHRPETQEKINKVTGKVEMENKKGVYTMDVDAILGVGKAPEKLNQPETSKHETKVSKVIKNDKERVKSSEKKSSSQNLISQKSKSDKHASSAKNNTEISVKKEKSSNGCDERNIFNLMSKSSGDGSNLIKGDKPELGQKNIKEEKVDHDQSDINHKGNHVPVKKETKDCVSNKENNKSDEGSHPKTSDHRQRTTSGCSSSSSERHRNHSNRHDKHGKSRHHSTSSNHSHDSRHSDKHRDSKEHSSKSSSSHHKSESHRDEKHKSSKSSLSSSSSSSKTLSSSPRHRSGSSSTGRHKGSSSSSSHHHHASSKGHKSSHSSSKSSHSSSSSSKQKERSSSSRTHSNSGSSAVSARVKDFLANVKTEDSKTKGPKPVSERSVSHVDLFGEDSDASDGDVTIVEPPKEDLNIIELSSEADTETEDTLKDKDDAKEDSSSEESDEQDDFESVSGAEDGFSTADLNLDLLEQSLVEEDTFDECLRIFNEEKARPKKHNNSEKKAKITEEKEEEETTAVGKTRVARLSSREAGRSRSLAAKSVAKPSPCQVMHNRFVALQNAAAKAAAAKAAAGAAAEKTNVSESLAFGKPRVAHTAKVGDGVNRPGSSLLLNKRARPPLPTLSTIRSDSTFVGTNPKGVKRSAHTPNLKVMKRPTIPTEYGSKVPSNIRQRYLNQFIDECLKIYSTEADAFERALSEEKTVYSRSSSRTVYLNVAVNCIKKLRSEIAGANPDKTLTPTKTNPHQLSHQAVLGGKMAATTHFTVKRSGGGVKQPKEIKGAELYTRLSQHVLTETQLVENGFPRMSDENPGYVIVKSDGAKKRTTKSSAENERFCVRCGKRFLVAPNGNYVTLEECVHHWGKSWKRKIGNSIEYRFTCCQGDPSAPGCAVGKGHVHEQNKHENLTGYMQTMPSSPPPDGNFGVFALDCEMVYTTAGLELARVTVVNADMKVVFEKLVKPGSPIIDPNTRFSGLNEQDFEGVTATIRDVQAVMLSMFNDKSILVGHSLESDLMALRLVHNTVVDTSVVFPHRLGPPYKRALRNLMAEILQKIIQNDVGGHDSQEDAVAAMELMLWKVKEDVRRESRR